MALCALETYLYPHTALLKRGVAPLHAPVRLRVGGGAVHDHHQGRSRPLQEREPASKQTHRGRAKCLWAHGRSVTQYGYLCSPRLARLAHRDPVRRQARLLPSLHSGERCGDRTLLPVSTWNRRPGPAYGPRPSTPFPCCACSLSGPDTFGPQDGCGGTGPPLPKRPT